MEKLTRLAMIERLKRFREAGDKLSDDLYELSLKVLNITSELESKQDKTAEEIEIHQKLSDLTELIMKSTLDSDDYSRSKWLDYTIVVKNLSKDSSGARNSD